MQSESRLSQHTVVLLAALYCAQGLPSGLLAHAMPALMRQQGVDLAMIGLLKLLALPWVLKVLWAPWVDRLASPRLGHRRGWIIPLQSLIVLTLLLLAWLPPQLLFGDAFPMLLALLLIMNLAAATQDIATDGLAVRLLPPRWRGLGNSLQVGGYKVGMIISGSVLLLLMEALGWAVSLTGLAALVALMLVSVLLFTERKVAPFERPAAESAGPALLWCHYRSFLAQPSMGLWLLVLLTFKLGDAVGTPMIKPMLVDQGWSVAAIGTLTLFASAAGIIGALVAGLLYARWGARRSLLIFGTLQALGIAAMAQVAMGPAGTLLVYGISLFEQMADGMSTVALFAMMMNQCRREQEGADFTLQASAQVILAGVLGSLSGVTAAWLGYAHHFLVSGAMGLAALVLVVQYFRNMPETGTGQIGGEKKEPLPAP